VCVWYIADTEKRVNIVDCGGRQTEERNNSYKDRTEEYQRDEENEHQWDVKKGKEANRRRYRLRKDKGGE